jgi:DNA-binding transcriptional LysR family regulator
MVETADAGSVTEAAKRLNVSQPSISAALGQIEAELGIQVFVRHLAKGVTLSPAGQRLVNDARLLLNHARDFAQSAQSLGNTLHGEIVVGSFLTLATRFRPGLLSGFRQRQSGISVKLEEGNQQEIIDALMSGRTGLPSPIRSPCRTTLQATSYASCRPIFCCRPTILWRGALRSASGNCARSRSSCSTCRIHATTSLAYLPPPESSRASLSGAAHSR